MCRIPTQHHDFTRCPQKASRIPVSQSIRNEPHDSHRAGQSGRRRRHRQPRDRSPRPGSRPPLSAPISSSSPNWCWSVTRPRTWCSGPALVEAAAAGARCTRARKRVRVPRWWSRFPGVKEDAFTTPSHSSRTARQLRFKHELPNYGVFDEKRVFSPGPLGNR